MIVFFAMAAMPVWQAGAHEVRPAYLEISEVAPDRFDVLWKQPSRGELAHRLKPTVSNGLLDRQPDEQYSTNSFRIRRWKSISLPRNSFDGATVQIEGLERTLTDALVRIHFASGRQIQLLLKPDKPMLIITDAGKLNAPAYLVLGIWHILTGFDHLAFVAGLILLVHGQWKVVQTVTAFTLAHSITLVTAATGNVGFNASLIESLVALSIMFVAVELTRYWRGHPSFTTRYPWFIAFSFGLLHGFAFAGSLADIGLPEHNIAEALFLFNCGVEIGQLIFVAAALTLISPWNSHWQTNKTHPIHWIIAYGIGTMSCYWLFERISVVVR